ncbi:MAG: type I pullulanase [Bacillales bacterium]|nr:type I pullulanase [Bacillales bacterium]
MSQNFYCYLDAFDEITIIVPKDKYHPNTKYQLQGNDEIIDLEIKEVTSIGSEEKLIAFFDAYVNLELTYQVVSSDLSRAELYVGKVVRTSLFDSIYYYRKDDLGFTYTKKSTKFKIWSPVAKQVVIELIDKTGEVRMRNLFYKNQGIWRIEEEGDLEGFKYKYHVYVNGQVKTCLDPYAISSSIDNEYNYVIDKEKLYKMVYSPKKISSPLEAIIYETSIRDFTSEFKDLEDRATYTAFTKENLKTEGNGPAGFDYLKSLGVTHVQIMPFFSFGGIEEGDRFLKYNWGYNPVQYNVPSGLYSLNPDDPYDRINSLKKMIDNLHKAGLNVVMDVVYNHVYNADLFPFEVLCPGYAYRYNREGIRTNFSGCSNDIYSSKKMIRKFILDSILYWAKEYKIDGFRMDIMGLLDFETVNDIKNELTDIDPSIILYGEGWKMISSNASDSLAHMFNKNVLQTIGFFNDKIREAIKAYVIGKLNDQALIKEVILGSSSNRFLFKYTNQSINYVECHDDITLFDFIRENLKEEEMEISRKRALLATSMIILSQGIPFIHSGEEIYRTKSFETNTYKMGDEINMIKWEDTDKYKTDIAFLKELIAIRKEYPAFRLQTSTELSSYASLSFNEAGTILYTLSLQDELLILFKNREEKEEIPLLKKYKVLSSSLIYELTEDKITLSSIGTIVLKKE